MKALRNPYFGATSTLIGYAIGAGIFGIPFVFMQSGAAIGTIHVALLAVVVIVTLLAYAEVVLRTRGIHQFPGYASIYLGRTGKFIAAVSLIFGMYGALIAYITEVGHFLHNTLQIYVGGSELHYAMAFWLLASISIYGGLQVITRMEIAIVVGMVLLLVVLFIIGAPHIQTEHYTTLHVSQWFLPYGVILFALSGSGAIPEIRRLLAKQRKCNLFPRVIISGIIITAVFYLIFSLVVFGISGDQTSESAITGLLPFLGPTVTTVGAVFGILAMGSSFLIIGLALKQMYQYDFKQKRYIAWCITVVPPLLIYFLGLVSFIQIIGIVGAFTIGFQGILIWLMHKKAGKKSKRRPEYSFTIPPYIRWVFIILFIFGILYEIYHILSSFL